MITITQARVLIWIILSAFFFKEVIFPLIISSFLHLWTLIKHSKFIYIIINFIIISILIISSSSFAPFLSNLFLKLHKTLQYHHHDDHHQASHIIASSPDVDHDAWWFFSLPQMDNEPATIVSTSDVDENDASFGVQEVDKHCIVSDEIIVEDNLNVNPSEKVVAPPCDEDKWWFFSLSEMENRVIEKEIVANNNNNNPVWSHGVGDIGLEEKIIREEGEGHENDDSLDATWKAIMESKEKESRPHLKKSDTWSAGDGEVEERRKAVVGGLSKYRVTVQLKKWQSFRDMIERREYFGGGGSGSGGGDGGGGGGGGKRGWKSVDMALTFHDEFKKRADAFIDRFTDNIRLQRLESNQRFMDLMNRGQ